MTTTVPSDGLLLLEKNESTATLAELRRRLSDFFLKLRAIFEAIRLISLLRLLFLVLKRIVSIIKSTLKYFFISLPESALEFLYVLHFGRAYLRVISYFSEANNKNSAEVIKLSLSLFKIFISLLILSVLIVATAYGISPLLLLSMPVYGMLKTSFRVYSATKCVISLVTLIGSYYRREIASKRRSEDSEEVWLRAQYKDNYWKHVPLLVLGISTTILLSLLSFVGISGLGPIGFIIVIVLVCSFLLIDIIKSIHDFHHSTKVAEPEVGSLKQKNSWVDYSFNDYYYRKCRIARLSKDLNDLETNQIYLLKEIVVKILQLEKKLKSNSFSSFIFFSEKPKIQEKIEDLKQAANRFLSDDYKKNELVLERVREGLNKDYQELNEQDKTLIPKEELKTLVAESLKTFMGTLLHVRDDASRKKNIAYQQRFRQSFFRKIGDCEDISDACQGLMELKKNQFNREIYSQTCQQG